MTTTAEKIICKRCSMPKDRADFYLNKGRWVQQPCRSCISERRMEPERRERAKQYSRDWRRALRERIIAAYGGACECCGETAYEFLAIDHRDGGGKHHRRSLSNTSIAVYQDIERRGYPPEFRILCHNCNSAIGFYGYCPHERNF